MNKTKGLLLAVVLLLTYLLIGAKLLSLAGLSWWWVLTPIALLAFGLAVQAFILTFIISKFFEKSEDWFKAFRRD